MAERASPPVIILGVDGSRGGKTGRVVRCLHPGLSLGIAGRDPGAGVAETTRGCERRGCRRCRSA